MYYNGQSSILPKVSPLWPGMGGSVLKHPVIDTMTYYVVVTLDNVQVKNERSWVYMMKNRLFSSSIHHGEWINYYLLRYDIHYLSDEIIDKFDENVIM